MIAFSGRGILLDIEGTVSSVAYVTETLFPFARRDVEPFLRAYAGRADVLAAAQQLARDGGDEMLAARLSAGSLDDADHASLLNIFHRLMDGDVKATGLKQLQGMIWESGFKSGELVADLFEDVAPALRGWRAAGLDVRIYSSGSIAAQKLFFGHTRHGDLTPLLSGHYDTTIGQKRTAASYAAIAADWGIAADEILFASDIPAELDAAYAAGVQTALAMRPGNASLSEPSSHAVIRRLDEIVLTSSH